MAGIVGAGARVVQAVDVHVFVLVNTPLMFIISLFVTNTTDRNRSSACARLSELYGPSSTARCSTDCGWPCFF